VPSCGREAATGASAPSKSFFKTISDAFESLVEVDIRGCHPRSRAHRFCRMLSAQLATTMFLETHALDFGSMPLAKISTLESPALVVRF
jgi:hypothetical protein